MSGASVRQNHVHRLVTASLAVLATSSLACASLKTFAGGCGTQPHNDVCVGQMSAPEEHECLLESASALAIDAIYSEEFEAELGSFASFAARSDTYGKQWQSFDVSKVAEMLRSKVRAVTVSTYGGVPGWWVYVFSGNLAYDGATDGPIRLNRWGLPRSRASVANSIAHEVAHRAALEHPHSDTNLSIAECEPPYVIGTLVEKHASRGDWKLGKGDCVDLNVLDRESAHPPIKKAESAGEEAAPMPSAVEN